MYCTLMMRKSKSIGERPFYDESKRREMYEDNKPVGYSRKNVEEFAQLKQFSSEVVVILQTFSAIEYEAATTLLKPPLGKFTKPVMFPRGGIVVGMFAEKKAALIRMKHDYEESFIQEVIDAFPKAKYVVGVGVSFAFDRKYQLGDILVSEKICNLSNTKYDFDGEIEIHSDIQRISGILYDTFCSALEHDPGVKVSDTRDSKVYKGTIISQPTHVLSLKDRDRLHDVVPTAIGGEIEGGLLMKFEIENIKVMIIKGVVDYGDGNETEEWEFTATMAALLYTKSKLEQSEIGESKLSHFCFRVGET